jgi:putative hemolysin
MAVTIVAAVLVAWLEAGVTVVRLASRMWLRQWAEQGLRGAAVPHESVTGPQQLIAAGSAAVGVVLAVAAAAIAARPSVTGKALALDLLMCAAVIVFVAQLLARAVARHFTAGLAPFTLPLLRGAGMVTLPVVSLARRALGVRGPGEARAQRRAVERLLREGELEGLGASDDVAMISGVAAFGEKCVREVMTPRDQVFAISDATHADAAAEQVAQSAYSRVPVYHGSLDRVTGMIHAFDLLRGAEAALAAPRPIARASGEMACGALLFQMLRDHRHLAVVRDASDRTIGIVTLEDLLEELVGDIRDEHDEPASPPA